MALIPISEEIKEYIQKENDDPETLVHHIQELKKWISEEPLLPQNQDDVWLERFFCGCKCNVERCKKVLRKYYKVRRNVPEWFGNRDPASQDILNNVEILGLFVLPQCLPDGRRMLYFSTLSTDWTLLNSDDLCKRMFMTWDAMLQEELNLGYVLLVNMAHTVWTRVLQNFPPWMLKKLSDNYLNATPVRVAAIHFINAPVFIHKLLLIVKPLLKEKLRNRIYVHPVGNFENLHQVIDKKLLPKDFGGELDAAENLNREWHKKVESYKEWFLRQEKEISELSRKKIKLKNKVADPDIDFMALNID